MLRTRELFESVSTSSPLGKEQLTRAVDALVACEQTVTTCAVGMLAEKDADELRTSISQDLDCADVAAATRNVLTRGTNHDPILLASLVEACRVACERSNRLCAQHAQRHEHCRICSETTGRTAEVCVELLNSLR